MPPKLMKLRSDASRCVHAGEDRHRQSAPLTTPIAQTAVFALTNVNELRRYAAGDPAVYLYSRYGNPTIRAAEEKIAALEAAPSCVLTSSGMSAIFATILGLCRAGDEIVSMLDIYGGTLRLFENILTRCGIKVRLVPFDEVTSIERHFTRRTRMLFLESPTNPTLRCVDLRALCAKAHKRGICAVVDNTFATPILQKPLALGADVVVHSATKYLGGHSDLTAGAVAGAKKWLDPIRTMMIQSGSCSDPGVAYLLLRGLKTLHLRVERACRNAFYAAEFLSSHSKVARVFYPGLPGASHEIAQRQMRDFGMMVSFDIRGSGRSAERFIDSLQLWTLATSLGGVESTVSYPVLSSHIGLSARDLKRLGVSASTVRLSLGVEDHEDLIADLEQALRRA